ncbi:MAG: alcohol dehydrogenase catalytic domain-containing protein [Candidatus Omnitrophica bacterium]|nr:alcohol dehydrogenase catalytic domain-containing protein [Candidatus Omnitrophota bacterium]
MRAAVYYSNNDIRIEERPKPAIGEGELLVQVEASGICGTDCLEWYRIDRVPLVLGHEIAGVIVEAGKGVKKYKAGDRVSASHHVPCGECRFCLAGHETVCDTLRKTNFDPGGFAEFIRIPEINVEKGGVYPLPKDVSFEEATFLEPLACVVRGQRLAGLKKGMSVLVVGSGISGLLHIQLAKVNGAKKVVAIDVAEYRLNAAQRFGADHALYAKDYNANRLREINDGFLADLVILSTGAKPAYEEALKSVEHGGTALFFAATDKGVTIPISINDLFWRNEVTLMSSYAGSPEDHIEALTKIASKKINVRDMITHRLGLAETSAGFSLVSEARDSIKVIIEPQR